MKRRTFLQCGAVAALTAGARIHAAPVRPNIVFVFADQWRAQALGYTGDPNVYTPHLDRLAAASVKLTNMISGWPVCSPYRGTLLTGQHPDRHGIFLNDVPLAPERPTIGDALQSAGYHTGYIGKWHLDGHGRSSFIPRERRQGFDHWKVLECTHDYNRSFYYADGDTKLEWEGYDAFAQTADAVQYIEARAKASEPFALFLSWGPPHNPYETAPERFKALYNPAALRLRANVPGDWEERARTDLAGYYAHCSALDESVGVLWETLQRTGIEDNTVFVFTSDHGDMLGSQGEQRKQRPWDESIRVPFLIRYPRGLGNHGRTLDGVMNSPDILPTLLDFCDVDLPPGVQGRSHAAWLYGEGPSPSESALLACYSPFGEWTRAMGGREFRGVRNERFTYVESLEGPWLLYDNHTDPFQMKNLAVAPGHEKLRASLQGDLRRHLDRAEDSFSPGAHYVQQWGYSVDESGTASYAP